MTTPNIEELIARNTSQRQNANAKPDVFLAADNITALRSQAERIKELEAEIITRASYGDEQTDFAIKLAAARDALRAELDAIAATEPVARAVADKTNTGFVYVRVLADELLFGTELFTHPMPAQDVKELVELLEFMWREVSMNDYAFEKLEAALSKYKGAK